MSELDEIIAAFRNGVPPSDLDLGIGDAADEETEDGYKPDALEDAHVSQRIADDWLAGRYCWAAGLGWLKWDGSRWRAISDAAITEVTRKALRKYVADEVARGADAHRMRALASLLHASKIRAVVSLARGIVEVEANQFDTHPDLLNVGNGIIDLTTSEVHAHDPGLYLTKIATVDYLPGARHEDWDRALAALPDAVADWMQVRMGQAATGHMAPDDLMPVMRGSGANGKSTFVKGIKAALGDHAVVIPDRVLLANPGDHPTEMMTLRGARFALLEELPEGRHLNVKRLKDTVGTSPITARSIGKDNITWDATHTLMLTTNYLPLVDEVDHGTWRRLALVEFPFTFTASGITPGSPHERAGDEGLRERLADGAGGRREAILAWVVEGARRWYAACRVMPTKPERVAADTDRWRSAADRVFAYFKDRLVVDPDRHVASTDMYSDFTSWHQAHGNKQWSDQTFATRFEQHGEVAAAGVQKDRIYSAQTTGLSRPEDWNLPRIPARPTVWRGIRFRTEIDDQADQGAVGAEAADQPKHDSGHARQGLSDPTHEKTKFQTYPEPLSGVSEDDQGRSRICPDCSFPTYSNGHYNNCQEAS